MRGCEDARRIVRARSGARKSCVFRVPRTSSATCKLAHPPTANGQLLTAPSGEHTMREVLPGLWDLDEIGTMVHAYLWQWEKGVSIVDSGTPGNAGKILGAVQRLGYAPEDVQRLIVTHADIDHVGNLKELKRVTGAPVACHTVEREFLEHPERRGPSKSLLGYAIRPLFALARQFPAFHVDPVVPDELYVDGDRLPEGFIIIHTPGHTPGHIALLHPAKRFLIAGDALNARGGKLGGPPPLFTPDVENANRSIWKLWKKYGSEYDAIVFGHGEPILDRAGEQIKTLVDQLFEAETPR
jgi:glyoxylase-like metal-dependent hydrolase (beta-lactamase superfamily II)